jgi:hypothetical protein
MSSESFFLAAFETEESLRFVFALIFVARDLEKPPVVCYCYSELTPGLTALVIVSLRFKIAARFASEELSARVLLLTMVFRARSDFFPSTDFAV